MIGDKIKQIRKNKNISQKDFAEVLKIPVSTLANYENNHRDPNLEILKKIANALNISIETLTSNESFEHEILSRAIQLATKDLPSGEDVFNVLGLYANQNILIEFYTGKSYNLTQSCIKGLLDFIAEKSKTEFNKIYKDLIETDIYNLDSELEDYCQKLYINTTNPLDWLSKEDKEFLESLGYIKDGQLSPSIEFNEEDRSIKSIQNENKILFPPVKFNKMKSKVDSVFPALDAEIKFLSDPNIEKTFNYSFDKLAMQGGYQELLILAIEKAIKDTLDDIKNHIEAGDLFDGVSSWITKESPLYEILKAKREENK